MSQFDPLVDSPVQDDDKFVEFFSMSENPCSAWLQITKGGLTFTPKFMVITVCPPRHFRHVLY